MKYFSFVKTTNLALIFLLGYIQISFASKTIESKNVALIYNGKIADEDSAEALAEIMESLGIKIVYFDKPDKLPALLEEADICVIGGTKDDLEPLLEEFTPEDRNSLAKWLKAGGIYIGICGGAYIASKGWEEKHEFVKALDLVPLISEAWIENEAPRIITVSWDGKERPIYYQYGPFFLNNTSSPFKVLSKYDDGKIAALSYHAGKGTVVLFGPHPEADETWLDDDPTPIDSDNWSPTRDIADDMFLNSYF